MEEELMFARIHDALDIEPPAGAYERLRTSLTKKPVRPYQWPALQTRWTNMGFRFAAALALVALAVAIAAAIFAVHNATNNSSPAGTGMSIQAYKNMIATDSPDPSRVWTNPCDERIHAGCAADASRSIPLLQKWFDDVNTARTPARFVVVNAEIRQHLSQSLTALRALLADSGTGDQAAMTRDYIVAVYAVNWNGTVVPGIAQSQQVTAAAYQASVSTQKLELDACIRTCTLLVSQQAASCTTNGGVACEQLFDEVATPYATFEAALIQNAAPDSLSTEDGRLQGDLAQADAVLLTMRLAVATNDQAGINSGVLQLRRITAQIDLDANKILQG